MASFVLNNWALHAQLIWIFNWMDTPEGVCPVLQREKTFVDRKLSPNILNLFKNWGYSLKVAPIEKGGQIFTSQSYMYFS